MTGIQESTWNRHSWADLEKFRVKCCVLRGESERI